MKKIILIIAALTVIFAMLLAGCDNNSGRVEKTLKNDCIEITEMSINWNDNHLEYKVKNISDQKLYFRGLDLFVFYKNGDFGTPLSIMDGKKVIKLEPGEETELISLDEKDTDTKWYTVLMQGYNYQKNGDNTSSHFYIEFERDGEKTITTVGKKKTRDAFERLLYN